MKNIKYLAVLLIMIIASCSSGRNCPAKSSNRANKSIYYKSNSVPYHPKYTKYKSYDQYKK